MVVFVPACPSPFGYSVFGRHLALTSSFGHCWAALAADILAFIPSGRRLLHPSALHCLAAASFCPSVWLSHHYFRLSGFSLWPFVSGQPSIQPLLVIRLPSPSFRVFVFIFLIRLRCRRRQLHFLCCCRLHFLSSSSSPSSSYPFRSSFAPHACYRRVEFVDSLSYITTIISHTFMPKTNQTKHT